MIIRDERGFTLVEALISLVVLGIVSLISINGVLNLHDYIRLNNVLTTFQADLHYARDFNMLQLGIDERMIIRIYHEENRYKVLNGQEVLSERVMPNNITIPNQNEVSTIAFTRNGNLGQGRTITFNSRYRSRRVVFSVGTGGFDVRN